jgi:hypothetical protein
MLARSAKDKGRRYENLIAKAIRDSGLDPRAGREIGSGSGTMKGDIRSTIPFLIEAKNQKTVHALDWIDQAKEQASSGFAWKDRWALVFRDPRTPESQEISYVVLDFYEFLNLLKKAAEPKMKNPDRAVEYKLKTLIRSAKEVLKEIEE